MPDLAALVHFLEDHRIRPTAPLTGSDLTAVRDLRPKLRPVFGLSSEEEAVRRLNAMLVVCRGVPELVEGCDGLRWQLQVTVTGSSTAHLVGATAAFEVLSVIAAGGFDRLHVCDGVRCAEVFIDVSRNRSRRYCSPAICGNRASAAAHRSRRRAER